MRKLCTAKFFRRRNSLGVGPFKKLLVLQRRKTCKFNKNIPKAPRPRIYKIACPLLKILMKFPSFTVTEVLVVFGSVNIIKPRKE